jgi:hypothetical protein
MMHAVLFIRCTTYLLNWTEQNFVEMFVLMLVISYCVKSTCGIVNDT